MTEFQGKTAEYQAFFVFDESGKASARDPFLQNSGLDDLITASVYPMMLLRDALPRKPQRSKVAKGQSVVHSLLPIGRSMLRYHNHEMWATAFRSNRGTREKAIRGGTDNMELR